MSLAYIIDEVCEQLAFDPIEDREYLLRQINKACKEIYEKTDLPGCLREITVTVEDDNIIALPYWVGELRAMRNKYTLQRVDLTEQASRYAFNGWAQQWNNWAILRKSPLKKSIENAAYPILWSMENACLADINLTITGAVIGANKRVENFTIEAGQVEGQLINQFTEITSITKTSICEQNITFTGRNEENTADIELAVLYNDRLNSLYTIVDISKLPYGPITAPTRYVDVLFKSPLPRLEEDGEEFICQGYDDAIVAKVCEYKYANEDGGSAKAVEFYQKCNQIISQTIEHTNGASDKQLVFAPNGYLGLYRRGRGYSYAYRNII